MNDQELARRSILNFGEMMATLGSCSAGPEVVVRRANAIGARIVAATGNPWFDGAVVPLGMAPPRDDQQLPYGISTLGDTAPGRIEQPDFATPCMGLDLALFVAGAALQSAALEPLDLGVLGDINERAYGDVGVFGPLARALLSDNRIRAYGLRSPLSGEIACAALTLTVADDLGVHYVATEERYRRSGLASTLVSALLSAAKAEGLATATLQASADGLPVWIRLGFRRVATLRGYVRPANPAVPA
jgi:GNAT superfamily N-acetyltransferase